MSDMLASAAGQVGQASGLSNIGSGIANLFTGGSQAVTPEQAARATMPGDTLFGMPTAPPSTVAPTLSPSFLQGFAQGFTGQTPGAGADMPLSPGAQIAGGVGQLFHAINQLQNPQALIGAGLKKLAGGGGTTTPGDGAAPMATDAGAGLTTLFGMPVPPVNVPSKPLQGPEAAQTPPGYVQAKAEDPMQAIMKLAMIAAAL